MALSLRSITRSFAHRNYRLFFVGQIVSLIGTWITSIATSWLVYRLTGSTVLLAAVNAAGLLPSLVLTPYAGVQVDRWNRRKVLLCTQTLSMLQSFALAALTLPGSITTQHLFVLVALQGVVNAFDLPARQAFVSELVDSAEDLSNAIALNSAMFNAARLIGPAIGGAIIAATGEGLCFLIDGVSYLAVIAGLFLMRLHERAESRAERSALHELRAGFAYVFASEPLMVLIGMVGMASFCIGPYVSLLPAYVHESFGAGPATLGQLMGCSGFGALVGALYLASRESVLGLGRVISRAGIVLSAALFCVACAPSVWVAALGLGCSGASMILLTASCNTMIQTIVEPSKRGRVMSMFGTAFTGMMPLAGLLAGFIATFSNVRVAIGLSGVVMGVVMLFFVRRLPSLREKLRPIYRERGILKT